MEVTPRDDAYSPSEIARAAGVPVARVRALVGPRRFVPYGEALEIGRTLAGAPRDSEAPAADALLFSLYHPHEARNAAHQVFLAASASLHAALIAAAIFVTTLGSQTQASGRALGDSAEVTHLVFLATPGPGGGGGGGGGLIQTPPPRALREGTKPVSSPLEVAKHLEPVSRPIDPPLRAEPLPVVIAPIVSAPADAATRMGVLTSIMTDADSLGRGHPNGVGAGTGSGSGDGEGPGVGPGSGGGTGGGPYRGGSGIAPPRVVREVKADYTDEARRRGATGVVIMEIVVRRDGSVGDVKLLKGLGWGLDEQAILAVRQWRFAPAERLGTPVDVVVEVAVEFKFR